VAARTDFNLPSDKTVLLFIANNPTSDLNKGWGLLCNAIENLQSKDKANIQLVVVGGKEQIALSKQFPFTLNWIESLNNTQLSKLYSAADALLVPSRAEAFSLVTAEAQLCGLPVIGFEVGFIPEIIIDKKTGWVAEANKCSSLTEGIKWILSNKENAQQATLNNRKQIVEKLSPKKIGEQYLSLYKEILNGL
jgi:glycosyltransferase involved in cell wall biosynthesis